jgi:predicted permease
VRVICRDVYYTLRGLIKRPIFAIVIILSLAIGIGLNVVIYSIFDELYVRELSTEVSDQQGLIWMLTNQKKSAGLGNYSYRDYLEYRKEKSLLENIIAWAPVRKSVIRYGNQNSSTWVLPVSGNYFNALGIKLFMGRNCETDDGQNCAIVSYGLWKTKLNGDASSIGKEVMVGNRSYTIVGVTPKQFNGLNPGSRIDVYVMLEKWVEYKENIKFISNANNRFLELMARLKPGVSIRQAKAALQTLAWQLQMAYPETNRDLDIYVAAVKDGHPVRNRKITMGVVGFLTIMIVLIFLIPCTNVATLLLNRAVERRQELVVRAALGATRIRIMQQLMSESLTMSALGGGLGLLLALWMSHITASIWMPLDMPMAISINIDKDVIAFAIVLCIVISMIFGTLPMYHVMRMDLTSAMRAQEYLTTRLSNRYGIRAMLVIGEIAVSLIMMAITILTILQNDKNKNTDYGFNADSLQLISVDLEACNYDVGKAERFGAEIRAHIRDMPGIISVSAASVAPYSIVTSSTPVIVEVNGISGVQEYHDTNMIGEDYFSTLNVPILRGRQFYEYPKMMGNSKEVIINESMAARYWPEQNPLGKKMKVEGQNGSLLTVIGIVKDSPLEGAKSNKRPMLFRPLPKDYNREMTILVRSYGKADYMRSAIIQSIIAQDNQMITSARSLRMQHSNFSKKEEIGSKIMIMVGIVALGMAIIGLYSVVSYAINQRIKEIGIRMAVGASPAAILRLLASDGIKIIIMGVSIGLILAWIIAHGIQGIISDIGASNIYVYILVAIILSVITLIACFIPVRKVIRSDPTAALRQE